MLKPWRDLTEKEINDIKFERCINCKYAIGPKKTYKGNKNVTHLTCHYICITGQKRGVRPEECEHYKEK